MSLYQVISGKEILSSANSEEGKKERYNEDIEGIAIRAFPKAPLEASRWLIAEYIGRRSVWGDQTIFCEETPLRRLLIFKEYLKTRAHEMKNVAPNFSEEMNWFYTQDLLAVEIKENIKSIF